jgi:hypothetical protein
MLRWIACMFCVATIAMPTSANAVGELSDLAARLQFHYYAGDARGLRQDLDSLLRLQSVATDAPLRDYYLAYGYMALFKTAASSDRSESRKAASECVKHAEQVLNQSRPRAGGAERERIDALHGELWAIKATCLGGTLLGSAGKARDAAQSLAPQSPRVRLLAAIVEAERAKSARELDAASRQLYSVAQAFQSARAIERGFPDWGQAEAWAWLGHIQLRRGDRLAAREALESALVLAPDYEWARRLRAQVTSGR